MTNIGVKVLTVVPPIAGVDGFSRHATVDVLVNGQQIMVEVPEIADHYAIAECFYRNVAQMLGIMPRMIFDIGYRENSQGKLTIVNASAEYKGRGFTGSHESNEPLDAAVHAIVGALNEVYAVYGYQARELEKI